MRPFPCPLSLGLLSPWAMGSQFPWFSCSWPWAYRSPSCFPSHPFLFQLQHSFGSPYFIPIYKTIHILCPRYALLVNVQERTLGEMEFSLWFSAITVELLCISTLQRVSTHTRLSETNEVSCFQLKPIIQKGNAHQNSLKDSMLKNAVFSFPI